MNILSYSAGQDTGGQGARIAAAFRRHSPDIRVVSIAANKSYIDYPVDEPYSRAAVRKHWLESDLVHLHNTVSQTGKLQRYRKKPIVMHHHGTRFRTRPDHLAELSAATGAVRQIVATLDLEILRPDLTWVPSPFDISQLSKFSVPQKSETILISHAPTNRLIKSTDVVIAAVHALKEKGLNVELDLIENQPWRECLRRKGRSQIYCDQIILGYGNNAIEAWGMGIPVVAGVVDERVRNLMLSRWGTLPFFESSAEDLSDRLEMLVRSESLRQEYALIGIDHAMRWHDERNVVATLSEIYQDVATRKVGVR